MKNFTTKIIFTFALLFTLTNINAQTFPYLLVTETDTYANLQEATVLSSVGDSWDDPEYVVPIGFNFEFYGEEFSSLTFGGLGGMVFFQDQYTVDSLDLLFASLDDLIDIETIDPSLQSTISHTTEGTAGSQIFKLEWDDCGFFNEAFDFGTIENRVTFQMWLYEGTNDIEFRFGPSTIVNPNLIFDFGSATPAIIENFTTDASLNQDLDIFWYLTGASTDPSIASADSTVIDTYNLTALDSHPADGQVYRLLNPSTSTSTLRQELAVKVYPTVVVDNFSVEVSDEVLAETTTLFVHNNLGLEVYNNTITNYTTQLNASKFPAGIYYVTVMNENGKSVQKLIKQ